jgi:hypothetical protein
MVMARTVIGWTFVAIMVIGVIYAAVSPALQPIVFPRVDLPGFTQTTGASDYHSLVKGANVSQTINFVDLNATVKFGVISVTFSVDQNLAVEARFDRGQNASALEITRATRNQVHEVNMYGEAGALNITLGRSLQYEGSLNLRIGGANIRLDQYDNVSKLEVKIEYIGGVVLDIHNGASFEQLDLAVDLGGVLLNTDADHIVKDGEINVSTKIGGVSMGIDVINPAQVGISLEGSVDVGGITTNNSQFVGTTSNTHCSLKTANYQSEDKKIDIEVETGLGGITLQPATQNMPGFTV